MTDSNNQITVSICCITYNHEKYISQALEGFLMQKTNFNVEILIGEDCSTDNTKTIIEDYCEKHPGKIKLLANQNNIGPIRNQFNLTSIAKGRYIAMCDGDDFWIDPYKLQKQVDFLDANPQYVICCHYTKVIDEHDNIVYLHPSPVSLEFEYQDVLLGKREETRTSSLVVKNIRALSEVSNKDWYLKTYGTDTFFKLYATSTTKQKIYVLPDVMSCYRLHTGGVWSMIDTKIQKSRMISDFNLTISNFKYTSDIKRKLLKFYLSKYFLFDVKHLKFKNVMDTIGKLTIK